MVEAVEAVARDRADWLLDAVACATQDRRFLRGDPAYDEVAGEAILLNGAKAIRVALAAARPLIMAEAAGICEQQAAEFLSEQYAVGQPLASFAERFACSECARAIRTAGGSHEQG